LDKMLGSLAVDWRELVVMLVIERVPGISQTKLIPFLQTDKANVTKVLQAMEREGFISREADPQDQRSKVCSLIAQGKALTPQMHQVLSSWEAACFNGLSPEELSAFHRISGIIIKNLDK
jgi:DNA-binding MarR family transcriptional regulator